MTRLIDAPVIITRLDFTAEWFCLAANELRRRFDDPPEDQKKFGLKKLAEDIWAIDGALELHVDKTRRGFRVFGLVLANDMFLDLATGASTWALPIGTVYHIDGRAPHGALKYGDTPDRGVFGFMAWDVHRHESVEEMLESIPDSMTAFAAGEARIDVAMGHARTIEELTT